MNSVQLAVIGGHIELVRDLVDNFKATIDFSTNVRKHAYVRTYICIQIPIRCDCVCANCTAYSTIDSSWNISRISHSFGLRETVVMVGWDSV